jgi:alginate O-acetyltransferase complex protein AlgI
MITMLLCGLWHGANWTYVVWGASQGLLLVLHRLISGEWDRLPLWTRRLATFSLWTLGLVIFRASGFGMAATLFEKMFSWQAGAEMVGGGALLVMLALSAAIAHWAPNTFEMHHQWSPKWVAGFAVAFGICLLVLYGSQPAPYIYFQF